MTQERTEIVFPKSPVLERAILPGILFLALALVVRFAAPDFKLATGMFFFWSWLLMSPESRQLAEIAISRLEIRVGAQSIPWEAIKSLKFGDVMSVTEFLSVLTEKGKDVLIASGSRVGFPEIVARVTTMVTMDVDQRAQAIRGIEPLMMVAPRKWSLEDGPGRLIGLDRVLRGSRRFTKWRIWPGVVLLVLGALSFAAAFGAGSTWKFLAAPYGLALIAYAMAGYRAFLGPELHLEFLGQSLRVTDPSGVALYGASGLRAHANQWAVVKITAGERIYHLWGWTGGYEVGDWVLALRAEAGLDAKAAEPSQLATV